MSYLVLFCSWVLSVLLALRLPRLWKRELISVLFVRLFDLHMFGFVCFLFLLVSGKGCGLWLWHSLDFSLMFFSNTSLQTYWWALIWKKLPLSHSGTLKALIRLHKCAVWSGPSLSALRNIRHFRINTLMTWEDPVQNWRNGRTSHKLHFLRFWNRHFLYPEFISEVNCKV